MFCLRDGMMEYCMFAAFFAVTRDKITRCWEVQVVAPLVLLGAAGQQGFGRSSESFVESAATLHGYIKPATPTPPSRFASFDFQHNTTPTSTNPHQQLFNPS